MCDHKSLGTDGLFNIFEEDADSFCASPLSIYTYINISWKKSEIPLDWKKAVVVSLQKYEVTIQKTIVLYHIRVS
jgi:hypothetical protein